MAAPIKAILKSSNFNYFSIVLSEFDQICRDIQDL